MAGSISLSLSQQFDAQGKPLSGGKLYFFQAGTSTPQNSYQDVALSLVNANPITLDASGRVPAFYLADGQIKIRLTDQAGVTILAVDNLLVIGPSSGAGSPPSVDATTILATGDVKARYGTGTLLGWVRLNGRTIGSATSGASERANADCQALFEYLWTTDANLAVSGGRGASANADWTANKTIALPDGRGRVLAALDDMGGAAAGRLTATYFGTGATTLGAAGGTESKTLVTGNLPPYTPAGSLSTNGAHTHTPLGGGNFLKAGSGNPPAAGSGGTTEVATTSSNGDHTHTFTGTAQGGTSTPFATVPPMLLVTWFIKL
jgi:hypothetical protein